MILAFGAACSDVDAQWQLDHERIIAVRATPPHILAGSASTIDVLVGHDNSTGSAGSDIEVVPPVTVVVQSPLQLTSAVNGAIVKAPDGTTLDQIRGDLGLGSNDPVPLEIEITANTFTALKTVYLGDSADNPTLDGLLVNGVAPPADMTTTITIPKNTDVPLFVDGDDINDNVNWLTSIGTMDDFGLHDASINVGTKDTSVGNLGVVYRDNQGGVTWQWWPLTAQ